MAAKLTKKASHFFKNLFHLQERRRRLKRPLVLNIIGVGFILFPAINLLFNALYFDLPLNIAFAKIDTPGILLLLSSPVIGFGILQVKRWGWYAFILFAISLLGYNLFLLLQYNLVYNWFVLIHSAVLLIIAGIILRKDITAPYFSDQGRGFRRIKRKMARKAIRVNGELLETIDYSKLGALVLWPACQLPLGSEVTVQVEGEKAKLKAGIVRIENQQVGLAFRGLKFFRFYF